MDSYNLFHSSHRSGLSLGAQHILFNHSLKRKEVPEEEDHHNAAQKKPKPDQIESSEETIETGSTNNEENAGNKVDIEKKDGTEGGNKQEHPPANASTGSEVSGSHQPSDEKPTEERGEGSSDSSESKQDPAKPENQGTSKDGTDGKHVREGGTTEGLLSTNNEGSTESGDGHETVASEHQKQPDSG